MKLRLLLVFLFVVEVVPSAAQNFTAVTGTIVDPNGLLYSNCNITAELIPAGTNPTINGAAIGGLNRAGCDGNGSFNMNLGSNAVILPGGTQWKFTVNTNGAPLPIGTGPQTCSAIITISGASQNISGNFSCPLLSNNTGKLGTTSGAFDSGIRANGPIGPNWTQTSNGINISSNTFIGTQSSVNSAFWSINTFPSAQFSQVGIGALNGTTDLPGPSIYNQPSGANYFACVENTTTISLVKVVNGGSTTLASVASTGLIGDVLRIEIWPGASLVCNKNGSPILTATDNTFTSGSPGITITGNVATLTNFYGGAQAVEFNQNLLGCTLLTPATVNANVTTDQNLTSCTIPFGMLGNPGMTMRIYLAGVYSTPAASTTAVNLKLKLCTVAGCGSGSVLTLLSITSSALGSIQATNNPFILQSSPASLYPVSTGNWESHGTLSIGLTASSSAADSVFPDTNTAAVGVLSPVQTLFLQASISFTVASASNSATVRQFNVRIE